MAPEVWSSADPYDGLEAQLTELRGLVKIVPPLVEADRERRWEEIGARPGDPDSDMIDIYEKEAGPEEGWGHADYSRTVYSTAVVSAWEIFHAYLVRQLFEACLRFNLSKYPVLAKLVDDERRSWDRRFDRVQDRYRDFLGIQLAGLSSWEFVLHARELRNALVHNLGQYTARYLSMKHARRPTKADLRGLLPSNADKYIINRAPIPLTKDFSDEVIGQLIKVAKEIDDALKRGQSAV